VAAAIFQEGIKMNEEKKKLLSLMRFWLVGTYMMVFAIVVLYVGMNTGHGFLPVVISSAPTWGLLAVVCAVWYFAYVMYLKKQ
jgi:hypothetical protein